MCKIGVIGTGIMGVSISSCMSNAGMEVRLLTRGCTEIANKKLFNRLLSAEKKNKITKDDTSKILNNVYITNNINDLANVSLVIECVVEDFDTKKSLFYKLNAMCGEDTIFCTNTSSLSVLQLALSSGRKRSFVGVHFLNPADVIKFVEIVRTKFVLQGVIDKVIDVIDCVGYNYIVVNDTPGFIVNALLFTLINTAANMLDTVSIMVIDSAIVNGLSHPENPLRLADRIGLDVCYTILTNLYNRTGNMVYKPAVTIKKLVDSGNYGKKTGRGFYQW